MSKHYNFDIFAYSYSWEEENQKLRTNIDRINRSGRGTKLVLLLLLANMPVRHARVYEKYFVRVVRHAHVYEKYFKCNGNIN